MVFEEVFGCSGRRSSKSIEGDDPVGFVVRDTGRADQEALKRSGAAGVMKASENVWHVIVGQRAPAIALALDLILDAPCKKPDQFHLKK